MSFCTLVILRHWEGWMEVMEAMEAAVSLPRLRAGMTTREPMRNTFFECGDQHPKENGRLTSPATIGD